ncbi:methyl-accepting chemotaxis protein [Pistricoccus aurantiacus]|uniref:methyl-accepting chemotaxis protein n=1 Tax=Pistricoccus aurantiacus TaxID=1883414 RepID=UPI003629F16B
MKLKTRLVAGFSTVIVLMVILTGIGIAEVDAIDQGLTTINDVNSVKQRHAIDFRGSVHDRAIALRDITLVEGGASLDALLALIAKLENDYQAASKSMQAMFDERSDITDAERQALTDINQIQDRARPLVEQIIAMRLAGRVEAARGLLLNEVGPLFADWLKTINVFIDLQESMNQVETASARDMASGFKTLMLALCGAAVAVGFLVAFLLTRWLLRTLGAEPHQVTRFAEAIGRGELATKVKLRQDDHHSIMASLLAMARQLQTTVANVRGSAQAVADSSEQIARSSNELASRTEQQASSLTEAAASMEQLGSTVHQNADNARQASEQADNASRIAVRGGEAVGQVIETMQDLNQRSKEIVEIIGMIDSIAFQTNILALNASVEAARAGEHGRGFAVVASEVRLLAQRSADASKQINTLITGNLKRVEEGSELVAEAGRTTDEIVASIKRVTQLMGEISSASAEQSDGVQQVGEAVTQMDQATQQNAALVADSADIANQLSTRAQQLAQAMAIFKLDDDAPSVSNLDTAPDTKPVSFESIIKEISDAKPATQEYDWQSF